ncbi:hypothetical protein A3H11_02370 [Candidatus Uhrbacteria bacterium RIFCSPLOWO2_12_FULL_47_10]|nr:MAG: hypothetical protein A3H11_02370 [Candidatus Uhrbacteria bacterium RIFCSPLOWO2_12_FULL_47_10]
MAEMEVLAKTATLTRFSARDAACLLTYDYLYQRMPSLTQLAFYCGADGSYSCAIADCTATGNTNCKQDAMVTVGPFVLCHSHGREVLKIGRYEFGLGDEFKFYYLFKTLHNAGVADDRAAENPDSKRTQGVAREMETRQERLPKARELGNRLAEKFVRQKEEAAAQKTAEQTAQTPTRPVTLAPATVVPEEYAGKSKKELMKLAKTLNESFAAGFVDESAYQTKKAAIERALKVLAIRAMEEAIHAKKLELGIAEPITSAVKLMPDLPVPKLELIKGGAGSVPARKAEPITVACNMAKEVKGNPSERLSEIPKFRNEELGSAEDCFAILGTTKGRYDDLLAAHSDLDTPDSELHQHDSVARKQAKALAKSCLLHGPEFKTLGYLRYKVIEHIKAKWPEAWQAGKAHVKNGAKGSLRCADCGASVSKLFDKESGAPDQLVGVCGGGRKRHKNAMTRARREGKRGQKAAENRAQRSAMKSNEGSGLLGQSYRKKGGKK